MLFRQGGRWFEAIICAVPLVIDIAVHPTLPARSRRFLCEYITALAYFARAPENLFSPIQRANSYDLRGRVKRDAVVSSRLTGSFFGT